MPSVAGTHVPLIMLPGIRAGAAATAAAVLGSKAGAGAPGATPGGHITGLYGGIRPNGLRGVAKTQAG